MKTLLITITLSLFAISATAQGHPPIIPPGCDNPVPGIKNPNCPDDVPLSGVGWMVVIGSMYGTYRIYKRSEKMAVSH